MKWTFLRRILPLIVAVTGYGLQAASAQTITVQGKVSTPDNPGGVPGVSVMIKGTSKGMVTDEKGHYQLTGVSASDSLIFSYIGFSTKTIAVNGKTQLNVVLQPESSALEQVVVIGYGTQKKKDLTGAISSVDATKLENENPTSVQDLLRANVPGLNVGFSTTARGQGNLEIRGKNTLNAGSDPLIVLDGVIYYGELSDINPNDIATIDVLKDASSAAVYGAKSASGVILITTKKGKTGKPTINFNANYGIATMEVNEPVYGPDAFIAWREDVEKSIHLTDAKPYQFSDPRKLPSNISLDQWLAYDGSGGDPVTVWLNRLNMQPIEIANYKAGKSVDWYDQVFHNAKQQDYTVSLSGKNDKVSYYWSLGYLNNEGIIVGDKFSTVRTRLNLEGKVTKFLTVGLNTQFADRDQSEVPVDWNLARINSPWGSMYTDDSSDYRYSPNDEPGSGSRNPFSVPKYTDRREKYYTLNTSIYAKVSLPFGFSYKVNFTPRFEWFQYFNHQSSEYQDWAGKGGIATRQERQVYQWQVDNLLTWSKTFNQIHHFDVTLLANAEKFQLWRNQIDNNGFDPNDNLGYGNIGAGTNPSVSSGDTLTTGDALMARLFYSLKSRYLVTLSVRRDGYSAFGQKNPRATFPAVALGWVFTEEPFFKSDWFDYGKLRLSWGVNGNRDIGGYVSLSDLNTGKYLHVTPDGTIEQVSQLYVNNMANPKLQWEQTASYNIGLDFSLFHSVLDGSIDMYKSQTTNLLVKRLLPDFIGFDFVWTNLGEVDNKGIEINLNSHNIAHQNFSWTTSFNFSLNRNKIVHLYGDMVDVVDANGKVTGQREADDITNKWFIGHPLDAVWDIKVNGVYQEDEEAEAAKYGVHPGDFELEDVNGDGKYTDEDRQFLGYKEPRFRWALRNEFTLFKNIDVSFLIYSYWGHMNTFNQAKNREGFLDRVNSWVVPYWTPDNPLNDYARLYSSDGSASYSVYRKKSFIRLENVALAYTFPKDLVSKARIENLRVYFTVKNVGFWAPEWTFWDPEHSGPTPRTFSLGLDLTL